MRLRVWITAIMIALSAAPGSFAQAKTQQQAETLRIWGDPFMASVLEAWEGRFRRAHPEVRFENNLMGTDTAMPGLYGGAADLALFGRESNQTENDGFLHSLQYKPLQFHLMTGSLDAPGKSFAPAIFVQETNPTDHLTMAQLVRIFGCGQASEGTPAAAWGDLGLTGEWKDKPIHVYAVDMDSGTGTFFLRRVQGASKKMNWPIVREFSNGRHTDGTAYPAAEQTMDALKADPYGIAVSGLRYSDAGVKPVAIAVAPGAAFVKATRESLIDGSYAFARMTYAFVDQPPGKPIAPLLKEFLRLVFSEEGQKLIAPETGFLPLSQEDAKRQLDVLR